MYSMVWANVFDNAFPFHILLGTNIHWLFAVNLERDKVDISGEECSLATMPFYLFFRFMAKRNGIDISVR